MSEWDEDMEQVEALEKWKKGKWVVIGYDREMHPGFRVYFKNEKMAHIYAELWMKKRYPHVSVDKCT